MRSKEYDRREMSEEEEEEDEGGWGFGLLGGTAGISTKW